MDAAFAEGSFGHQIWPGCEVTDARSQGAEIPLRRLRRRLVRPACESAGARRGHADHHGNRDQCLLRKSTARDATMMNYKAIFVSDGTATFTDAEHNATLGEHVDDLCRRDEHGGGGRLARGRGEAGAGRGRVGARLPKKCRTADRGSSAAFAWAASRGPPAGGMGVQAATALASQSSAIAGRRERQAVAAS